MIEYNIDWSKYPNNLYNGTERDIVTSILDTITSLAYSREYNTDKTRELLESIAEELDIEIDIIVKEDI